MASNDILVKVGADISDYSRKMKESTQELKKFGERNQETFDAFKKTGAVITAVGATLTAGLGYAVSKAKDFEAGMSKVAAISGATGDEFEALEKRARELGGSTSFSAMEAAEGLEYLALAGWDTTQMIDGLEPVLHLAEAGALELGRTSDLVTDSMAGLGLEVDDLSGYLDKVAQTAANSNTDIDALMEAMVIAGGTFERLNVPLEESTAFLGLLANRGFKASEAGTAVNAIMTRLTSGTGQAAEALEELGISAFDSNGQFKGMEAVMRELEGALSAMDDETRSHYQTLIAGLNHGKTFNAMLNGLSDEYDELKGSIVDSDGALLDMRNTMKDNLQGAMENLSSAFEEIMISLGTALLPAVKLLVSWLQKAADWFNGLSDATKTTIAVTLGIVAALAAIGGPMLLIIGFIPKIVAGFATLKVVTLATTGAISGAVKAMYAKATASKVLGAALRVMTGPIGWVVGGVAALTAGVVGIVKWFKRETKEAKKLNAETDNLAEATDGLTDSIADSEQAYKDRQTETKAAIKYNEDLARKVEDLAKKENKSAVEKEMLRNYTEELNNSVEDLNLTYDAEADALSLSSDELGKRLELYKQQETANDAMERAKEITEETVKAEERLAEASRLREEWNQKLDDGKVKTKEYEKAIAELDEQEKELNGTLADLGEQYKATEAQVETSMGAIAESTKDGVESQIIDYESLEDAHKNVIDNMSDRWKSLQEVATEAFDKISEESSVSAEEMIENLKHNQKVVEDWGKNVAELHDKAGKEGNEGFLKWLDQLGPESAAELAVVNEMTDKQLKEFMKLMNDGASLATDSFSKSLGEGGEVIIDQAGHIITETDSTMRDSIKSAGFGIHGENIAEGTAQGIEKGTKKVGESVKAMAEKAISQFKSTNEIQSPSAVYARFGKDIAAGLKQGVDNNANGAVSSIKDMATRMTRQLSGVKSSFKTLGSQAIAGLNSGLESNKFSVINKAKGIANSITSTMRSALRIHSPSRVLKELGGDIVDGLVIGLDDGIKLVKNTAESMSQASTPRVELAYDTPGGLKTSLAGAVSGTVDVNARDDKIAGAINSLESKLTNLRIEMDKREFGRAVSDTATEQRDASVRGGGRRRI